MMSRSTAAATVPSGGGLDLYWGNDIRYAARPATAGAAIFDVIKYAK
jgi:hypothetical protein